MLALVAAFLLFCGVVLVLSAVIDRSEQVEEMILCAVGGLIMTGAGLCLAGRYVLALFGEP